MFRLRQAFLVVVPGVVFASHLPAADKPAAKETPLERSARALVAQLGKGEFEKATGTFNEALLKALPADKLKDAWDNVVADAGAFEKQAGSRVGKRGKYDVVVVTCAFAEKNLDAHVLFDKDGKITGLLFKPPRPTGAEESFAGTVKVGGAELRLVFHLFKQKDGTYLGTMDSPDQGASDLPLDEVSVKDDAVRLELRSAMLVYEGKRAKDGKEIVGDLKQAGQTLPVTLKKVAKAK